MRSIMAVTVLLLGISSRPAASALVVDSVSYSYSQGFDFNPASPYNGDEIWLNDFTLAGWSLYRVSSPTDPTPVPMIRYFVDNGSSGAGHFYAFGASGSNERALGGVGNGSFGDAATTTSVNNDAIAGWMAVSFMNNTGSILEQFTVKYDGEQWRDGGNNFPPEVVPYPQTMVFQYGFGSTFGAVSNWISPGGSFDFTSPVFTANQGAIDGNEPVNRTANLGGTITGLSDWVPGQTLWLRWIERNDNVVDHGLAIDDFSFSVTAVPEPSAAAFGGVIGVLALFAAIIRRFVAF